MAPSGLRISIIFEVNKATWSLFTSYNPRTSLVEAYRRSEPLDLANIMDLVSQK